MSCHHRERLGVVTIVRSPEYRRPLLETDLNLLCKSPLLSQGIRKCISFHDRVLKTLLLSSVPVGPGPLITRCPVTTACQDDCPNTLRSPGWEMSMPGCTCTERSCSLTHSPGAHRAPPRPSGLSERLLQSAPENGKSSTAKGLILCLVNRWPNWPTAARAAVSPKRIPTQHMKGDR